MADDNAPLTEDELAELRTIHVSFCGGSGPQTPREFREVIAFARRIKAKKAAPVATPTEEKDDA